MKQFKHLGFNDMGKTTTNKKEQCNLYGVIARLLEHYDCDTLQIEIDKKTKEISVTKCELSLDYYADYDYEHLEDLQP